MPPAVQQSLVMAALMLAALALFPLAETSSPPTGHFVVPYTGTLKKINESGVVRIGHRENSPPFAFLDPKGKPIGYSLDLCEIVVEEIVAELRKDIRVEYRPVTPENRFDLVDSGAIDLECGSTTNNFERRKVAAFSPTIFVTGTKLLVRRGSGILNFRDLQGKTVVLTRGTVQSAAIPRLAERQKLAIKFVIRRRPQRVVPACSPPARPTPSPTTTCSSTACSPRRSPAATSVWSATFSPTRITRSCCARTIPNSPRSSSARSTGSPAAARSSRSTRSGSRSRLPSGVRLNLPMSPHLEELFRVQGLPTD